MMPLLSLSTLCTLRKGTKASEPDLMSATCHPKSNYSRDSKEYEAIHQRSTQYGGEMYDMYGQENKNSSGHQSRDNLFTRKLAHRFYKHKFKPWLLEPKLEPWGLVCGSLVCLPLIILPPQQAEGGIYLRFYVPQPHPPHKPENSRKLQTADKSRRWLRFRRKFDRIHRSDEI